VGRWLDREFSEFIASCVAHEVRFLIVDGYALAARVTRGSQRTSMVGLVHRRNADRRVAALNDFGFGSLGLTPSDFLEEGGVVVQLGCPPKRIDILTAIDGVEFQEGVRSAAGGCRRVGTSLGLSLRL
jgi:hypothetical protein